MLKMTKRLGCLAVPVPYLIFDLALAIKIRNPKSGGIVYEYGTLTEGIMIRTTATYCTLEGNSAADMLSLMMSSSACTHFVTRNPTALEDKIYNQSEIYNLA